MFKQKRRSDGTRNVVGNDPQDHPRLVARLDTEQIVIRANYIDFTGRRVEPRLFIPPLIEIRRKSSLARPLVDTVR